MWIFIGDKTEDPKSERTGTGAVGGVAVNSIARLGQPQEFRGLGHSVKCN
jgi:hypothetical protein